MKYVLVLSFFLSGCVTPYQPNAYQGGYSEKQLSETMYQVTFNGNGYTRPATINDYFLRRCAELTIEKGYDFFIFDDKEKDTTFHGDYVKHSKSGTIQLFKKGSEPKTGSLDAKIVLNNFTLD